jgi:predicted RNA-binding Zn ribbon-like protein
MSTLAFELAATIRHDGRGGVADTLSSDAGVAEWVDRNRALVTDVLGQPFEGVAVDEARDELIRVRRAIRALFARAVSPAPPSKADADGLMDARAALRLVNRAAGRLGTTHLDWPAGGPPMTRWSGRTVDPVALLVGAVGRSTIDFLAGPDRVRLRACPAARCVKYFLQDDPRQTWCSPSCGNRERVNRYYRRRHADGSQAASEPGGRHD